MKFSKFALGVNDSNSLPLSSGNLSPKKNLLTPSGQQIGPFQEVPDLPSRSLPQGQHKTTTVMETLPDLPREGRWALEPQCLRLNPG